MQLRKIVLALGSNKGNRKENLTKALDILGISGIRILKVSSTIETFPWDNAEQEMYLNMVIYGETILSPHELLKTIKEIEKQLGRVSGHMEPREIDIDIILYDNEIIKTQTLQIPHPRFREREFVLRPLSEITPHLYDPVTGKKIITLYKELLSMPFIGTIKTIIGPFSVAVKENKIVKSGFFKLNGRRDYNPLVKKTIQLLRKYFEGQPIDFTNTPVNLEDLPPTYQNILTTVRRIPYGTVKTYGEIAYLAGIKNGARVVGNAMKKNPIPVIIPCHRVVRKDGIGGYTGGENIKEFLLKLELKDSFFDTFPKSSF